MTRSLEFVVRFHAPFRVGSAYARDGVHAALDRHDPLPADHLKGLMLFAAAELIDKSSMDEVFGSAARQGAWAWSSARPDCPQWTFSRRHRVAIDSGTHTAMEDHLVLGEQAFAASARFSVDRIRHLDPPEAEWQILVLRVAASGVHGIGAWRRRGLGWVGIEPAAGAVTAAEVGTLLARAGRGGGGAR
jgi:hypothetical protein